MGQVSIQSYFVVVRHDESLGLRKGEIIPVLVHQFEGDQIVRVMFVRETTKKGWFRTKTVLENKDIHMNIHDFKKLFRRINGAKFDPEMIKMLYE